MQLREYKVTFENNKPVEANSLHGTSYRDMIKCTVSGGKPFILWLVVFGYDETDAIHNAVEMVQHYLVPSLGLAV